MPNSMPTEKWKMEDEQSVVGASPEGARDRDTASAAVRQMFSEIAPRYDLANHVLSMNVDRLWWSRAARTFTHFLRSPDTRVLDLCCGTGDMTQALYRRAAPERFRVDVTRFVGADFAHPMLVRAAEKSAGRRIAWVEADALNLPVPNATFDLVTSAFGFRNLADYDAGLREIARVLRPGGEVGILDFGEPKGIFGTLYHFYFRHVLPKVGTFISGVRGPYAYLPASVARFPSPDDMLTRMRAVGLTDVSWTPYTFGIAGLFRGKK